MRILVTGGAGFLGSHVCEYYAKLGHDVTAFDNLTKHELGRTGYDARAARIHITELLRSWGVRLSVVSVCDMNYVMDAVSRTDFVVNCAAQPAMTLAYENPVYDHKVNVLGLINVLEAARRHNVPVLSCSTIHVYGNGINQEVRKHGGRFVRSPAGITEAHSLLTGRLSPLHASKRAGELYAQAFADSYDLQVGVFRLTGIYGPRQFGGEDHGWVANFAIRILTDRGITVYGTTQQVRDILYVADAVEAIAAWQKAGYPPGVYNIGGGEDNIMSIRQCLDELQSITGKNQKVEVAPARQGDLYYFCCDNTKATEAFGWKPTVHWSDGLPNLVEWVRENLGIFGG